MYGNPLPWKVTPLTPNLGKTDETDDMRPGLGWTGLDHLQEFVRKGGLLITANDTANFAVTFGFTPGVSIVGGAAAEGDRFGAAIEDGGCGQPDRLRLQRQSGDLRFESSGFQPDEYGGRRRRPGGANAASERERATGRGTADDPDVPQGRSPAEIPEEPHAEAWEALPLTDEQLRNPVNVIPPAARPRVVLRYANANELLVSGLLDNGVGTGAARRRDRFALWRGARGAVLEQSVLARGDQGQLLSGVQCHPEFRQLECREKAGGPLA